MIRNPRLRRTVGIAAAAIVILAWSGVAAVLFLLKPDTATRLAILTAAAILTEAMFWVGVSLLGIKALERLRIWRCKPRG